MPRPAERSPRIERIFERLDLAALAGSEDDDRLSEADVSLEGPERSHLAFGVYSRLGLERALSAYGSLRRLSARQLGPLELQLHLEDPFHPRIVLWARRYGRAAVDLTVSLVTGEHLGLPPALARTRILWVDGIALQHPGRSFDWRRPPLPGQEFPGLSGMREIVALLALMARRTRAQGIGLTPMSLHAAMIYARYFGFVDGRAQGELRALETAAHLRPLWLLAWAVELGCVQRAGQTYTFEPLPMLCPLHDRLARVFESVRYRHDLRTGLRVPFEIDFRRLAARFPWDKMPKQPPPQRVRRLLQGGTDASDVRLVHALTHATWLDSRAKGRREGG